MYYLVWDGKKRQLLWVVVFGATAKSSKDMGVIDASTGKFLRAG
jgi:hypothetical protein